MKLFIFLLLIYKIFGFPAGSNQFVPHNDYENFNRLKNIYNNTNEVESQEDDNANNFPSSEESSEEDLNENLMYGEYFQGDIELVAQQVVFLNSPANVTLFTGLVSMAYRWPKDKNGHVIVPYNISDDYSQDKKLKIRKAMNGIQNKTCIRFKRRKHQDDYIHIYSGKGCHSNLGKIGGRQKTSLNKDGCLKHGTIMHELIHALGFDHMHNRADRDQHVTILWKNIEKKMQHNFDKVDPKKFDNFGTAYDYGSVMHYPSNAFSFNGQKTIIHKNKNNKQSYGQRKRLSDGDVRRLNNMYGCKFNQRG